MHDEAASPRHREARSATREAKLSSKADIELEVSPVIFTAAREAHEKTKCASPTAVSRVQAAPRLAGVGGPSSLAPHPAILESNSRAPSLAATCRQALKALSTGFESRNSMSTSSAQVLSATQQKVAERERELREAEARRAREQAMMAGALDQVSEVERRLHEQQQVHDAELTRVCQQRDAAARVVEQLRADLQRRTDQLEALLGTYEVAQRERDAALEQLAVLRGEHNDAQSERDATLGHQSLVLRAQLEVLRAEKREQDEVLDARTRRLEQQYAEHGVAQQRELELTRARCDELQRAVRSISRPQAEAAASADHEATVREQTMEEEHRKALQEAEAMQKALVAECARREVRACAP